MILFATLEYLSLPCADHPSRKSSNPFGTDSAVTALGRYARHECGVQYFVMSAERTFSPETETNDRTLF